MCKASNRVYETNYANNETAVPTAVVVPPLPDLTVSSITAPATATSSGTMAVSWTVTNSGPGGTGNVGITDYVYLSFGQVLDSSARYLGSGTHFGGVASGASYTENETVPLPSGVAGTYYVIVETNANDAVYEQDQTSSYTYDPQTIQVSLPPPADLVAGTVTVPPNAVAGQTMTITYQVSNDATIAADGSWYDALYLSPTLTWSVTDPLLGKVYEQQDLAPGGSYTGTLNATLPGVVPGSYYVILRSNILDSFPELTLSNNLSASLTTTSIDALNLVLGDTATGDFAKGQSYYYTVDVAAGQTLQVNLNSSESWAPVAAADRDVRSCNRPEPECLESALRQFWDDADFGPIRL